jgi:hypothetical protein
VLPVGLSTQGWQEDIREYLSSENKMAVYLQTASKTQRVFCGNQERREAVFERQQFVKIFS